jgi:hypothetical protein
VDALGPDRYKDLATQKVEPVVLLAEDNEINRLVALEILTLAGFECDLAGESLVAPLPHHLVVGTDLRQPLVVDLRAAVRDRLVELVGEEVVARGGLAREVAHERRVALGRPRPEHLA